MSQLDPKFASLLTGLSRATLEGARACGFWKDGRIAFLNDAWLAAAQADLPDANRWGLGASYFEPMGSLLEPFYREAFRACLESGLRWDQTYFCNTPDVQRHFALSLFPLDTAGFLAVHTLAGVQPYTPDELASPTAITGTIHQCPHCRRVRLTTAGPDDWRWVLAWVRHPPAHARPRLCPPCADFYR